jgi:hypothetical protein
MRGNFVRRLTVTQRIAATSAGQPRRNGKARFMLLLPRIREAVAAKQSLRVIHDAHAQALGTGYVQFTRYVARYLGELRDDAIRPAALPARKALDPLPTQPVSPSAAAEPRRAAPERRRGFHVDPMAMRSKNLI